MLYSGATVKRASFRPMYEHYGKRLLDILLAALALLILSPLIIIAAAALLAIDGRPVIFRQQRTGRHGAPFTIYKFRTYPRETPEVPSADAGTLRQTAIGRFLRRSNIDELPQLWNILRGDMSIVGPRPGLLSQTTQQQVREANGAARLRTGLTGLAQIRGRDGMSETEKATHDGEYARAVTLGADLGIIVSTALFILRRPPVY